MRQFDINLCNGIYIEHLLIKVMNSNNRLNEALTSYNDLKGSIAVDFKGGVDNFEKFIRELNIVDLEKYYPVGMEISGYQGDINLCSIICVDRKDSPIGRKTNIPVTVVNTEIPFNILLSKINSLKIILHSQFKSASDYVVENTVEVYQKNS